MADKDKVFIFDTTMRDGEQSPGASMSLEEKIQISRIFDELGVDIVEAGFPIEIGRAHVRTPVTEKSRMPSSA